LTSFPGQARSLTGPAALTERGYEAFGELDYPPGHKRFFLQKRLAAGA
jgi:hypothetical protein